PVPRAVVAGDAAAAAVAAELDRELGVLDPFDPRHEDAGGAVVEHAAESRALDPLDPHERRRARVREGLQLRQRDELVAGAVLEPAAGPPGPARPLRGQAYRGGKPGSAGDSLRSQVATSSAWANPWFPHGPPPCERSCRFQPWRSRRLARRARRCPSVVEPPA